MTTTINKQEQQYQKPSSGTIIGGIIAGTIANRATTSVSQVIAPTFLKKITEINSSVDADEFKKIENATEEAIKFNNLNKKVSILKATEENTDEIKKAISKEIDKSPAKFLPKKFREVFKKMQYEQLQFGQNAFYAPKSKKILVPEGKFGLALFHEIGHAINDNLSKTCRLLQKCRIINILATPIAMIALFKTKKAPNHEPKNKLDKTTTFIKNNAGILTFASFLPLLAEEYIATRKGNKLAKKLLEPKLAQKVAQSNKIGLLSYISLATFSSLGIFCGKTVKDAIAKEKAIN